MRMKVRGTNTVLSSGWIKGQVVKVPLYYFTIMGVVLIAICHSMIPVSEKLGSVNTIGRRSSTGRKRKTAAPTKQVFPTCLLDDHHVALTMDHWFVSEGI